MKAKIYILLGMASLCGCATMTDRGRHQYVYIQSEPPGAKIIDGDEVLGSTPALVRLRRHKDYELELRRVGEGRSLELEGKYRWTESFLGNLAFLSGAPIGWVVDALSGAGWKYADPEPVVFKAASGPPAPQSTRVIGIAPPLAKSVSLSDESAAYWSKQLAEFYPHAKILNYHETLSAFEDDGFEFDAQNSAEQERRELFVTLGVDAIFVSKVEESDTDIKLSGHLEDVFAKSFDPHSKEETLASSNYQQLSWYQRHHDWFQVVPNTLGLEFSNTQQSLMSGTTTYKATPTGYTSNWLQAVSYLQTLTFSHLEPPRPDGSSRFRFHFVPGGTLSYSEFYFPQFASLADVGFTYTQVGLGIGGEVGWQSGRHYLYLNVIPLWTWTQLQWQDPSSNDNETMSRGSLDTISELGYLYFLNEHFSLRVFSRTTNSNPDLWNSVIHRINPVAMSVTSPLIVVAGVAVEYTFDTHRHLAK